MKPFNQWLLASPANSIPGWWFGTCFSIQLGRIIPTDKLIFSRWLKPPTRFPWAPPTWGCCMASPTTTSASPPWITRTPVMDGVMGLHTPLHDGRCATLHFEMSYDDISWDVMSSVSYPSLWQIPLSRRYASRKNGTWCEPDTATSCSVLTTTGFRFGQFYFSQTLGRQKAQWLRLLKRRGKTTRLCSGWWFGTFFIFDILGIIIPTDEIIFFRGVGIPPTRCAFLMSPSPFCCKTQPARRILSGACHSYSLKLRRAGNEDARNGGCKHV